VCSGEENLSPTMEVGVAFSPQKRRSIQGEQVCFAPTKEDPFGEDRPVRDPMLQGKEKRVGSKEWLNGLSCFEKGGNSSGERKQPALSRRARMRVDVFVRTRES
jgi:hypothetical protein